MTVTFNVANKANGVVQWYRIQPSNGNTELCITGRYIGGKLYWWDDSSHHTTRSVCEIRMN